jgi:hypothetical protein
MQLNIHINRLIIAPGTSISFPGNAIEIEIVKANKIMAQHRVLILASPLPFDAYEQDIIAVNNKIIFGYT